MHRVLLALLIAIAACGPSAKEVETARAAQYKTDAARIFGIAEEVTGGLYKIAAADAFKGALVTLPKWYTPDGQAESGGAGDTVKAGQVLATDGLEPVRAADAQAVGGLLAGPGEPVGPLPTGSPGPARSPPGPANQLGRSQPSFSPKHAP